MSENETFVRTITARIEEAKQRPAQALQHRHVIVLLSGVRYAIPMSSVIEIVRTPALTPIPGARAYIQGIFFHRGVVVPVIDIPKRFQSGGVALRVPEHIVLVEEAGTAYGFLVDRVVDAIECLPEAMRPIGEQQEGRLSSQYLLGVWDHAITATSLPFRYDFLIAAPSFKERYHENMGQQSLPIETYLLSVRRILEALEHDALSSVIQ